MNRNPSRSIMPPVVHDFRKCWQAPINQGVKIIDTRRTVTGILGVLLFSGLNYFFGPLPAFLLTLAAYILYRSLPTPA